MMPTAESMHRSVFPTAMAAATVPGTPLMERAAAHRRTCRKLTAKACFTVSRLTRVTNKSTTWPRAYTFVLFSLTLASCLLAQENYNTQGIPPPPGTNPSPAKMTFFVTSVGIGKGGNLVGRGGGDPPFQALG